MSNLPPWTIAILGTSTYVEPNDESEVDLSALDTTDPMTDSRWKKFQIKGIDDKRKQLNEIETYNHCAVHTKTQIKNFIIKFDDLYFPEGKRKQRELDRTLNNQWIYFYKGDYDDANDCELHAESKCLLVAAYSDNNHTYENGSFELSLEMQGVNPKY